MFYESEPSQALRLGDIVEGFVIGASHIKKPDTVPADHHITVMYPRFTAVLTPCCSIGGKSILLAPLLRIKSGFLRNTFLSEDLTRINRPMTPQQALGPEGWNQLPEEEKQRRLDQSHPQAYGFVELFIYAPDERLPTYSLSLNGSKLPLEIKYHMIDFRSMQRVECDQVINTRDVPLHSKILELSRDARAELRDKLMHYFGRTPKEDML